MWIWNNSDISEFNERFITGPQQAVIIPVNTRLQILPARSNRVCVVIDSQDFDAFVAFGNPHVDDGTVVPPQFGFELPADTMNFYHVERHGPLIQSAVYIFASFGNNNIVFWEWWDNGIDTSKAKRPPQSGVRMLNELGYLKDGCYNGPLATQVEQMARTLRDIRGSKSFGRLKQ